MPRAILVDDNKIDDLLPKENVLILMKIVQKIKFIHRKYLLSNVDYQNRLSLSSASIMHLLRVRYSLGF